MALHNTWVILSYSEVSLLCPAMFSLYLCALREGLKLCFLPCAVGVAVVVWQAGLSRREGLLLQQPADLQLSNL